MNELQSVKTVIITPPAAIVDNAAIGTSIIDTIGFSKARICVMRGALDIALAVQKLTMSDVSDMTGEEDVACADFSVSPLTLPSATSDNTMDVIHLDLRGKKRYLDLKLTGGDGTAGSYMVAWCDLYGAAEHPDTATERGFAQQAIV